MMICLYLASTMMSSSEKTREMRMCINPTAILRDGRLVDLDACLKASWPTILETSLKQNRNQRQRRQRTRKNHRQRRHLCKVKSAAGPQGKPQQSNKSTTKKKRKCRDERPKNAAQITLWNQNRQSPSPKRMRGVLEDAHPVSRSKPPTPDPNRIRHQHQPRKNQKASAAVPPKQPAAPSLPQQRAQTPL